MSKLQIIVLTVLTAGLMMMSASCGKKNDRAMMKVRMTDAPGDYQQVNVDVIGVEVNYEDDGWVSLPTVAGVYDLLLLQNNVTALLVDSGAVPVGKINQFRMLLGPNNSIMVDSVLHDLKTPSAEQSGLKLNMKYNFKADKTYDILLDFDASQSIVEKGNGSYSLKPKLTILEINEL